MAQEHKRLLPAVRSLQYGQGSIEVCVPLIKPPAHPNKEDLFTLQQLRFIVAGNCSNKTSTPITLIRTGTASPTPGAANNAGRASREAYSISVRATGVTLRAISSTGLFYATQTLRQLIWQKNGILFLPFVEIEDWPSMAYRGFMMDMAHGAVLTEAEVKRQLDELSRWKVNQYYFYAETTIELNGYPLLRSDASWPEDAIRRVIAYAHERHIEVVPCVELYGHLHDLFSQERYANLAGLPHGGEINPRQPKAIAITEDWLRQLASLFPSPWLHIGMDEPWELERADPTLAKPEQYYLEQLRRLTKLAVQLGKRPMFWADVAEGAFIFKKYPGLYSQLPKDAIAVPWYYSSLPDFAPLVQPFAENGIPQVVAVGISIWEETSPDFDVTFNNINALTSAGRRYGAIGMVNTGWTDSAQALYRQALPAMAYGGIAAWQEEPVESSSFFPDYARIAYPRAAVDVAQALTSLSHAQTLLRKSLGSETAFRMWDDPLTSTALTHTAGHLTELSECRLATEDAREALLRAEAIDPGAEILPSLMLAARIVNFTALKFIYAHEIAAALQRIPDHPTSEDIDFYVGRQAGARNHSRISDLMDESGELRRAYETAWLAEYRPFRLNTALGRWDAELQYWRALQAHLWDAMREFEQSGTRPTLETIRRQH